MTIDKMPVDKMTVGEMAKDWMTAEKMPLDCRQNDFSWYEGWWDDCKKMTLDEMTVDEMAVGKRWWKAGLHYMMRL